MSLSPEIAGPRLHRTGIHNMTSALSVAGLKTDLGKVSGLNAKVAVLLTRLVGTMWCAYLFAAIALVSLPDAIKGGRSTLVSWIAQTFLQLVLLPVIIVGQNIQAAAADARSAATYEDAGAILEEAKQIQLHLASQDAAIGALLDKVKSLEHGAAG